MRHAQSKCASCASLRLNSESLERSRLPVPGALERHLRGVEDVVGLEGHAGLGGPGGARLELRVDELDVEVLVGRGEGRRDLAAVLEVALVAELVADVAALGLVVHLRRRAVLAEGRHQLHARGLRLDQERGLQVDVAVANAHGARRAHLLQLVGRVHLGRQPRAAHVGRELDLGGLVACKVLSHLVAHAQVIAAAVDQVAAQRGRLQEVAVRVVVVRAVELRAEVAQAQLLAPAGLQVVEGGARAQVGGGDLGVVGGGRETNDGEHCEL
mmetsp:Transcript_15056/g.34487  ORF Transcript_15056/g.34487 Transcript_15056/m.34487 type:complete len:270 (+) Transcript_15056:125-934(+)